jgi:hypothetical protein
VRKLVEDLGNRDDVNAVLEAYTRGLWNTFYISVTMAGCAFLVSLGFEWIMIKQEGKTKEIDGKDAAGKVEKPVV